MKSFTKQLVFIAVGIAVITAGVLAVVAYNNRGSEPFIYLRMDEGQGSSTYDASGNANTGTITGATWQQEESCVSGKCLYFDGANDSVSISDFDL